VSLRDRAIGLALVLLAAAQPLAGAASVITGRGQPIGARSDAIDAVITPAGYAFGIWSVIFALSVGLAVAALIPRTGRDPALRAMRLPLAGAFAAAIGWMLHVQFNAFDWLSQLIFVALLGCVLVAAFAADRGADTQLARWLLRPLAGLYAGWVTAAIFVALANLLTRDTARGFSAGAIAGPLLLLAAAAVVAALVLRRLRHRTWYFAAVAWALAGVAVKATMLKLGIVIAAAIALALGVAAAAVATPRPRAA
jgi:hypothetical protein